MIAQAAPIAKPDYIPPLDAFGIPAPSWLFMTLMLVTLLLHLLFMNCVLGGTLVAVGLNVRALVRPAARERTGHITRLLMQVMPIAISFAITTGVAPLLFVQVLYGPYFYTSTVMLGFAWLSLIGFLIAGFYLTYAVSNRGANALLGRAGPWDDKPGRRLLLTLVAAACFLAIGWILTNNHVLSMLTDLRHWAAGGRWRQNVVYAGHHTVVPRLLHFVVGAAAVAGVWITAIGWWRRHRGLDGEDVSGATIRLGLWVTLVGSSLNVIAGVAFLFHHDMATVADLFRPDDWMGLVFAAGVFVLVPAHIATMLLAIRQPLAGRWFLLAGGVLVVLVLAMAIGREHLRLLHLARPEAGAFRPADWPVHQQTSPLLLFLVVFVAGLAVVGLMLRWISQRGTAGGRA